jgi:hypothetical protein
VRGWGVPGNSIQGGPSDAGVILVCRDEVQFVANGQTDAQVGESMMNGEKIALVSMLLAHKGHRLDRIATCFTLENFFIQLTFLKHRVFQHPARKSREDENR